MRAIDDAMRSLLPCSGVATEKVLTEYTELVKQKFGEPHRHYHGVTHVESLLGLAAKWRANIEDFEAVLLAIICEFA